MIDENTVVETRLDDGSLIRLEWTKRGVLSIQRYTVGNLKDGHGWWLSGSGAIEANDVTAFVTAGANTIRKAQDIVQKIEVRAWAEKRS